MPETAGGHERPRKSKLTFPGLLQWLRHYENAQHASSRPSSTALEPDSVSVSSRSPVGRTFASLFSASAASELGRPFLAYTIRSSAHLVRPCLPRAVSRSTQS